MPTIAPAPRAPKRAEVGGLYHEAELLARLRSAYYGVLNGEAEGFRAELRRLYDEAAAILRGEAEDAATDEQTEAVATAIAAFVEQWALPRRQQYGHRDVLHSLRWTARGWGPLALRTGPIPVTPPPVGRLWAPAPLPMAYDPTLGHAGLVAYAREVARVIRRSILDQGVEAERRAREVGYRPLPPEWRSPETLAQLGRRLYQWAVLRRSWPEIIRAEGEAAADARNLRRGALTWAKALDIRPTPRQPAGRR